MGPEPSWHDQRASGYRILAAVFAQEPTPEMCAELAGGIFGVLVPAAADCSDASQALTDLQQKAGGEDAAATLSVAFAGLFLGGGLRRSAPPYASAYLSETGRLYQEPARAMGALLRRADFRLSRLGEAPDHLGVQLELLAALAERDDESAADLMKEVRQKWVIPWIPAFLADCKAYDESGFYTASAALVLWLVTRDEASATPSS